MSVQHLGQDLGHSHDGWRWGVSHYSGPQGASRRGRRSNDCRTCPVVLVEFNLCFCNIDKNQYELYLSVRLRERYLKKNVESESALKPLNF